MPFISLNRNDHPYRCTPIVFAWGKCKNIMRIISIRAINALIAIYCTNDSLYNMRIGRIVPWRVLQETLKYD